MLFPKTSFTMDVSIEAKGANPKQVTINISEGEVPDEVVIASSIGGNSPRVRIQGQIRRDGFPEGMKVDLTPAQWFGAPRVVTKRELTSDEIRALALKTASENADERARLIAELQAMG